MMGIYFAQEETLKLFRQSVCLSFLKRIVKLNFSYSSASIEEYSYICLFYMASSVIGERRNVSQTPKIRKIIKLRINVLISLCVHI